MREGGRYFSILSSETRTAFPSRSANLRRGYFACRCSPPSPRTAHSAGRFLGRLSGRPFHAAHPDSEVSHGDLIGLMVCSALELDPLRGKVQCPSAPSMWLRKYVPWRPVEEAAVYAASRTASLGHRPEARASPRVSRLRRGVFFQIECGEFSHRSGRQVSSLCLRSSIGA